MVYYGALSKGCQRCRQRKIKCDQRKPVCQKCEKAKTKCSFRDLANEAFRDESQRIMRSMRKAPVLHEQTESEQSPNLQVQDAIRDLSSYAANVLPTLSQPTNELGVQFYFATYTCVQPPLSEEYVAWMTRMYLDESSNHALRAAIEATGLAGMSNKHFSPDILAQSKERYGRALAATKRALSDPIELTRDSTLMAVMLLGLFEFITSENWDQYRSWGAHLQGATALLKLRGKEQFNSELGGMLYKQVLSQVLLACMQQDIDVPPSIFQISDQLQSKVVEKRRKKREPAPKPAIGDLVFQFLRFRSTIRSGELTDPKAIRKAAVEMDGDLEDWTADLDTNWSYTTVKPSDHPSISYFDGKRHLYGSHWTAQMWNNWRTLRILVNKIILQYKPGPTGADLEAASLDLIHQLSNEICISSPDFLDSPRAATLIWPLSVVAKEDLNPLRERTWALEQLRHINSYMGLRQAGFLADNISQSLIVPEGETFPKA